jgi:malic enzyme
LIKTAFFNYRYQPHSISRKLDGLVEANADIQSQHNNPNILIFPIDFEGTLIKTATFINIERKIASARLMVSSKLTTTTLKFLFSLKILKEH